MLNQFRNKALANQGYPFTALINSEVHVFLPMMVYSSYTNYQSNNNHVINDQHGSSTIYRWEATNMCTGKSIHMSNERAKVFAEQKLIESRSVDSENNQYDVQSDTAQASSSTSSSTRTSIAASSSLQISEKVKSQLDKAISFAQRISRRQNSIAADEKAQVLDMFNQYVTLMVQDNDFDLQTALRYIENKSSTDANSEHFEMLKISIADASHESRAVTLLR